LGTAAAGLMGTGLGAGAAGLGTAAAAGLLGTGLGAGATGLGTAAAAGLLGTGLGAGAAGLMGTGLGAGAAGLLGTGLGAGAAGLRGAIGLGALRERGCALISALVPRSTNATRFLQKTFMLLVRPLQNVT
jgi:hypothetical protein